MSATDEHQGQVWEEALKGSRIVPHRLVAAMAHELRPDLSFEEFMTKIAAWSNSGATESVALTMVAFLRKDV